MPTLRLVVFAALCLACSGLACSTPTTTEPTPEPPPSTPPESEATCESLGEMQCITSPACTLVLAGEQLGYLCRPAEGRCELGFHQHGDSAEACEAEEGCRFVPGQCYCSPDVTCVCGGGPPPQCVEG